MRSSLMKWFANVSIAKKLYFVMGTMALLIALELLTLWFSLNTLSSVRAFVAGEGLWSKAQKDAIYHLQKYAHTHEPADYKQYEMFLAVPLGDHKTLLELIKDEPDMEVARKGFIEGRNHPDDVDGMIKLFRRFHDIYYINKAISIWREADSTIINSLIPIGNELRDEISSDSHSPEKIAQIISRIEPINYELTRLEDEFSYTLGEGARWLEDIILRVLFIIVLTVESSGLLLTISISIRISRGIKEIMRIAEKVAKVDFSERAKIYSNDEIGRLANSFNRMTDDLKETIEKKTDVEHELKQTTSELIRSNQELEQFAYIASHDLQEPLRMITSYVQLLENRYKDKLDEDAKEFIGFAVEGTHRMRGLILSLLEYSRVNKVRPFEIMNLNHIVSNVLKDLDTQIRENSALISVGELPAIYGDPVLITQLFQNIISNAIKFRSHSNPLIDISFSFNEKEFVFLIKDNGIGLSKEYFQKIFVLFQRLHTKDKYPGTGIGLALCKRIVEHHGGKIWVESEEHKGASFYFTIKK
ncbi:MAG: ATP-binding protein [Bacteroidia bacterium]